MLSPTYEVLVNCMTYNQSQYIEDALYGFAMQQTDFPFVCLVMDDASTDGEQEVIKDFLAKECDRDSTSHYETEDAYVSFAPHNTNHNCTFVVYYLKKNLYGNPKKTQLLAEWRRNSKYEATCEGDDFWTSPDKLQKQYEVMETHPDCSICFNRVRAIRARDGETEYFIPRTECAFREGVVLMKDLAKEEFKRGHWCFHYSSFFVRVEIALGLLSFKEKYLPSFPYEDMPLQMYALLQGEGYFLEEAMGCYRLMAGGWNSLMAKNPELDKQMTLNVIAGFNEYDRYTGYKYHRYIRVHNLRKEYYHLCDTRPYGLKYIRFNWAHFQYKALSAFHEKFPALYAFMKRQKDAIKIVTKGLILK